MSSEMLIDKLVRILKQKHIYDLNTLTETLKSDDFTKEDSLILLIKTLGREIKNAKTEIKNKHLYKCFKYLCLSENLLEIKDYDAFDKEINDVMQIISDKVKKVSSVKCAKNYEILKFYNKIINNLEIVKIRMQEIALNKNAYRKDYVEDTVSFIKHLVFNVKKYEYLEEIFTTYPQLISLKIDHDKYMVDEVITEYLNVIHKKDSNSDIVYYQKVIKLMLSSNKFSISKTYQGFLIKRLEAEKELLQYKHVSKKSMESQKFFMDEIISLIRNSTVVASDNKAFNVNYKYNIHVGFPKKVRDEVDEIKEDINLIREYGSYYDYTDKKVLTIDCDEASIFDDAFSYEILKNGNTLLNIYISDVSRFVKDNTFINKTAFEKASTIYLPEQSLTMLPEYLNDEVCSLEENKFKYALSYEFEFSENLDLVNFDIKRVVIKPIKNYTYDSLNYYINNVKDKRELEYFESLFEFVSKLKQKNIYNKNYHTIKNINKQRLTYNVSNCNYGDIIQHFLIFTNYMISERMKNMNGIYIYRNNISSINDSMLKDLSIEVNDENNISYILDKLSKMYVPSYYSIKNEGHTGLKLDSYGHNTSPIRRYVDLENQRLIKKQLIDHQNFTNKELYKLEEKLDEECTYINERNKLNEDYVKEYIMRIKRY